MRPKVGFALDNPGEGLLFFGIMSIRDASSILIEIAAALSAEPSVERVVLFGSRARGDADERSDFDIAVESPQIAQRAWLDLVAAAERIETLRRIDLVRLDETSPALRSRIQTEGKTIYERVQSATQS